MKELEKTKRISIATTLFILIVIMALLAYKRPKHIYAVNPTHTLEKLTSNDYFISLKDIENGTYTLIDIRNHFEFDKGHIEGAVNMYTPEILKEQHFSALKELKEQNKMVVLYGTNPNEVNSAFMVLYQLGIDNLKILTIENSYLQNKLVSNSVEIENSKGNIKEFIAESVKKAAIIKKKKVVVRKPKPKKVIKVKKKRKAPAEGGC